MNNNAYYWFEAEQAANQAPSTDPYATAGQVPPAPPPGGGQPQPGADPSAAAQDDVTQDPQNVELPEGDNRDYERWRHDFMELAVKADTEEMVSALAGVRDREGLEAAQRKFVEDNFQIYSFRRADSTVSKASKEVRNLVKQDLDRTNPGMTLMQHLHASLDANPLLYQHLIKLAGTFSLKGDIHRKWVGAVLGGVQTGSGGTRADITYCSNDYNIDIATRVASQWGEVNLGKWSLMEGDPKQYLKPDERQRMEEGSPEEKQVLRRRIILQSIAEKYRKRAFLIHVVTPDGTVFAIGWDLGNSLMDAYKQGKIVVRGRENSDKEVLIGDDGNIIPAIDYSLLFVSETGEVDDNGRPETEEVPFIERRDSTLYLVADLETVKTASAGLSGMFFKQVPYAGNPAEVLQLQRAIPGLFEILNKQVV